MKLSDLKLNPRNPRFIKDAKFKKLVHSIEQDPDFTDKMMRKRGIVVDKDNMILAGNMRYRAFKELGMLDIPDAWVQDGSDFTPEQLRRFIVQDNMGFGENDLDIMANDYEMEELINWGFEESDLHLDVETTEDEAPALAEGDPIAQPGELYQLGEHRLLCGDATKTEDLVRLMGGGRC